MKKLVVILLTILFVMGIYVPCFALDDPSPTIPEDIVVVDDDDEENPEIEKPSVIIIPTEPSKEPEEDVEKHDIDVEVHFYQFIDEIENEETREQLKEAYEQISTIDDISNLVPGEIEEIAHSLGAETTDLVVRDLFDVSAFMNGEEIAQTGNEYYSFTLKAENLENFVCLLVYHDHEWHVVDNVEVLVKENLLKVITKELSPFAIVVATKFTYTAEAHGCIWHLYIAITMLVTFVLTQFIRRKDENNRKRNILIRDILCLISLILSIIFYIFGTCKYDIYALIADITIVIIVFVYSHPIKEDTDNE